MLDRVKKRNRSKTISISLDLWEEVAKLCHNKTSISSFINMSIKNELLKRGIKK